MENSETLLDYVKIKISNIDVKRENIMSKMTDDFNHAFEWSYCEELYVLNYRKMMFTRLVDVINDENDTQAIVKHLLNLIKGIQANINRGNFIRRSTNIYSNIAHTLMLEEDAKYISTCETYIKYLTNQKMPMQLK